MSPALFRDQSLLCGSPALRDDSSAELVRRQIENNPTRIRPHLTRFFAFLSSGILCRRVITTTVFYDRSFNASTSTCSTGHGDKLSGIFSGFSERFAYRNLPFFAQNFLRQNENREIRPTELKLTRNGFHRFPIYAIKIARNRSRKIIARKFRQDTTSTRNRDFIPGPHEKRDCNLSPV